MDPDDLSREPDPNSRPDVNLGGGAEWEQTTPATDRPSWTFLYGAAGATIGAIGAMGYEAYRHARAYRNRPYTLPMYM